RDAGPVGDLGEHAGPVRWFRVSVLGLELLTIEARMVVTSVDTYQRYAEAIGLPPLAAPPPGQQLLSGWENGHHAARQLPSGEENRVRWDEEHRLFAEIVAENDDIRMLRDSLAGQPPEATQYERIQLGERVA